MFSFDPFNIPLDDTFLRYKSNENICVIGIFGKFKSDSDNFLSFISGKEYFCEKPENSGDCWISCALDGDVIYLQLNSLYHERHLLRRRRVGSGSHLPAGSDYRQSQHTKCQHRRNRAKNTDHHHGDDITASTDEGDGGCGGDGGYGADSLQDGFSSLDLEARCEVDAGSYEGDGDDDCQEDGCDCAGGDGDSSRTSEDFTSTWDKFLGDYERHLLFLFTTCHILINHSETKEFDITLLQRFTNIERKRLATKSQVRDLISNLQLPDTWIYNSRQCTPCFVTFAYGNFNKSKKEGEYDNLIFRLLKHSHLISTSHESLLCVPSSNHIVCSHDSPETIFEFLEPLIESVLHAGIEDISYCRKDQNDPITLENWISANKILYDFYTKDHDDVATLSSTENFFKSSRGNYLKKALHVYKTELPVHYDRETHVAKLKVAVTAFQYMVNVPYTDPYVGQLEQQCTDHWRLHESCPRNTIYGQRCSLQKHSDTIGHQSKIVVVSTCNCGLTQRNRYLPFTLKEANIDFYQMLESKCCRKTQTPYPHTRQQRLVAKRAVMDRPRQHHPHQHPSQHHRHPRHPPSHHHRNRHRRHRAISDTDSASSSDDDDHSSTDSFDFDSDTSLDDADSGGSGGEGGGGNAETETTERGLDPSSQEGSTQTPGQGIKECNTIKNFHIGVVCEYSAYKPSDGLPYRNFTKKANFLSFFDYQPVSQEAKRKQRKGISADLRLYFGLEYECNRGHRFLCSSANQITRSDNTEFPMFTGVDMPLYTACQCGEKKGLNKMALLSRVYAGCPEVKGDLRPLINLDLQVVFGGLRCFKEIIPITNGNLMVVRLPYAYEHENIVQPQNGGVLKRGFVKIEGNANP